MKWTVVLLVVLTAAPTAVAMPARVFRISPIVGVADPTLRDNPLSLDDARLQAAMMDVDLPAFHADQLGPTWGNERFTMGDAPLPPNGTLPRRDDPRFLEQMAFFYLNHAADRLEALGYTGLFQDGPIYVFAHQPPVFMGIPPEPALNPDAMCCPLVFHYRSPSVGGDGGTGSSAEDADTIVHEFGHYVHSQMAPDLKYDPEWYGRYAEGTADLLSSLLNDDLSHGVGDACQSEWLTTYWGNRLQHYQLDGYPCSRILHNDFVWPADQKGEIHQDGMFWSGAMWDIRDEVGTNVTLRLLLEALPLLHGQLTSFEDLASAVLLADAGLYGGAHEDLIQRSFARHGIHPPPLASLLEGRPAPVPKVADPTWTPPAAMAAPSAKASPAPSAAMLVLAVALVGLRRRRRA